MYNRVMESNCRGSKPRSRIIAALQRLMPIVAVVASSLLGFLAGFMLGQNGHELSIPLLFGVFGALVAGVAADFIRERISRRFRN
jgi:hypothetical protein